MEHHHLEAWRDRAFVSDWMGSDTSANYLDEPRAVAVAVVGHWRPKVSLVIDVAAGPGSFIAEFLSAFPAARAVWTDGSEVMREEARKSLHDFGERVEYHIADMRSLPVAALPHDADAVLTSRASHHLTPRELVDLYRRAAALLSPGGWLANLDHVYTDAVWSDTFAVVKPKFHGQRNGRPEHRHTRPLPRLDEHLSALAAAGFVDVEVVWKAFKTALIMARTEPPK